MERNTRMECFLIGLLVLQAVASVCLFPVLPERIPSHWDMHGQVNGWMDRFWGLAILLGLSLGQYLLLWAIPLLDPKKKIAGRQKAFNAIRLTLQFLLLWMFAVVMAAALDVNLSVHRLAVGALSIVLIILGNYMGKIRPNYFMGIRTPWTLEDPVVWRKTHRLGGPTFILAGLIGLIGNFWNPKAGLYFLLIPLVAGSIYLVAYSWFQYKRLHPHSPDH